MARFYKAVEIEEQETEKRRSMSVDIEARRRSFSVDDTKVHGQVARDVATPTTAENLSILKRRLPEDSTLELKLKLPKQFDSIDDETENSQMSETTWNTKQNEVNTPVELSPSARHADVADDYTASTLSSDDEGEYEFEKDDEEIPTRRSQKRGGDLETYHPPRMLSPYRAPGNSEAAAVLTKPMNTLPDPNFKPKPILKRPASADGRRPAPKTDEGFLSNIFGRRSVSPSPLTLKQHRKSVEIDVVPKIMFDYDQQPSPVATPARDPTPPKQEPVKTVTESKKIEISPAPPVSAQAPQSPRLENTEKKNVVFEEPIEDPETVRRRELARQRSEETSKKMLQLRQTSLEEAKVVANFYGDIIKDISRPISKPKLPIYMDPEALKKLQMDDDDEEEEKTENDSGITSSTDLSPSTSMSSRPFSPTRGMLNKSVKSQVNNIQPSVNAARTSSPPPLSRVITTTEPIKKAATTKAALNFDETDDVEIDKEKLMNEIQTRGRTIIPKPTVGVVKKRDQSYSRTRDSSQARQELTTKNPAESTILRRREKSQSRTRNRSESKSPSAMNRKVIVNKVISPKVIADNSASRSKVVSQQEQSSTPSRPLTPSERQEEVDLKVKSSLANATDMTIFVFAAYLYFFKSAILALPILMLLIYRQIADKLSWFKRKKS